MSGRVRPELSAETLAIIQAAKTKQVYRPGSWSILLNVQEAESTAVVNKYDASRCARCEEYKVSKARFVKKQTLSESDMLVLDPQGCDALAFPDGNDIDYHRCGRELDWSSEDISVLKAAGGHRKVFAFVDISVSRQYGVAWDAEECDWVAFIDNITEGMDDDDEPGFDDDENMGVYGQDGGSVNSREKQVRNAYYWNKQWLESLLHYMDKLLSRGFDGIVVGGVYAHDRWNGKNLATGQSYREDMVVLIAGQGSYIRRKSRQFYSMYEGGVTDTRAVKDAVDGILKIRKYTTGTWENLNIGYLDYVGSGMSMLQTTSQGDDVCVQLQFPNEEEEELSARICGHGNQHFCQVFTCKQGQSHADPYILKSLSSHTSSNESTTSKKTSKPKEVIVVEPSQHAPTAVMKTNNNTHNLTYSTVAPLKSGYNDDLSLLATNTLSSTNDKDFGSSGYSRNYTLDYSERQQITLVESDPEELDQVLGDDDYDLDLAYNSKDHDDIDGHNEKEHSKTSTIPVTPIVEVAEVVPQPLVATPTPVSMNDNTSSTTTSNRLKKKVMTPKRTKPSAHNNTNNSNITNHTTQHPITSTNASNNASNNAGNTFVDMKQGILWHHLNMSPPDTLELTSTGDPKLRDVFAQCLALSTEDQRHLHTTVWRCHASLELNYFLQSVLMYSDGNGNRLGHQLCAHGDETGLEAVLAFLRACSTIKCVNRSQKTLYSAFKETAKAVSRVVVHGANGGGLPPLSVACATGNLTLISILLKFDADITAVDNTGLTCIHIASRLQKDACLQSQLTAGGNVNTLAKKSQLTPLMCAARSKSVAVVELLLRHGANVYLQDINGNTALVHAVKAKATDIVLLLLQADVCTRVRDSGYYCQLYGGGTAYSELESQVCGWDVGCSISLDDNYSSIDLKNTYHMLLKAFDGIEDDDCVMYSQAVKVAQTHHGVLNRSEQGVQTLGAALLRAMALSCYRLRDGIYAYTLSADKQTALSMSIGLRGKPQEKLAPPPKRVHQHPGFVFVSTHGKDLFVSPGAAVEKISGGMFQWSMRVCGMHFKWLSIQLNQVNHAIPVKSGFSEDLFQVERDRCACGPGMLNPLQSMAPASTLDNTYDENEEEQETPNTCIIM